MIRAVVDTNTLVSGFGWRGTPGAIVDAMLDGSLGLVVSPPLLDELARVLRYPKLVRVFPEPDRIVTLIASVAEQVQPVTQRNVVVDEPDNRVLEAAEAGEADLIITGDRRLRALDGFRGIDILTAEEALERLDAFP